MKQGLFATLALLASAGACAKEPDWQPKGAVQAPLWPASLAIARPETSEPEKVVRVAKPVGGRPWTYITNVARQTMAVFPARGRPNGAAVLVFPGGGYYGLAIDLEGTEVCDWATAVGMACAVLKYRTPQDWHKNGVHRAPPVQLALQDAQRAMALLRQHAARYRTDPHRIDVIGFSAGGHLVAAISNADARTYPAGDEADRQSTRPDFAIALYPGHLWSGTGMELFSWNRISPAAPPTLLIQAMDDPVDDVRNSIAYALALRAAKVPVDLRLFAQGGHAFGLRPTRFPISRWPALAEAWLRGRGLLAR